MLVGGMEMLPLSCLLAQPIVLLIGLPGAFFNSIGLTSIGGGLATLAGQIAIGAGCP